VENFNQLNENIVKDKNIFNVAFRGHVCIKIVVVALIVVPLFVIQNKKPITSSEAFRKIFTKEKVKQLKNHKIY